MGEYAGRAHRLAVAILLIAAGMSGPLAPSARAEVATSRFGMNTLTVMSGDATRVDAVFDQMNALGATWIRADFEWSGIETTQGNFSWARTDIAVDHATAHDINVLATLDYTPSWARTDQTSDHYPPDDPADFAAFARATVLRYKDRVHHWEIWNEPNYWRFWLPQPDVGAYTTLLKQAYAAIKAVDPAATVMVGGLTVGSGENLPSTFLQNLYDANGGTSNGLFDAVAWHPYCRSKNPTRSTESWCAWSQMNGPDPSGRSIMVAHGDGAKQIWPTEYGSCTGGTGSFATTETKQAANLKTAYGEAGKFAYLGPLFWYNLQDSTSDQTQSALNFCGLTTVDGTKKIAWDTYRRLATGADTQPPTNVAIFTPADGTTVSGTHVALGASAHDNVGVTKVVYFVDGARLGTAFESFGYAYTWDSTAAADGKHRFFVKAFDAAGNITKSASVTLIVDN